MSLQIFLQGKLLGIGDFLLTPGHDEAAEPAAVGEAAFPGRSQWVTLLGEILPRALLAELGLSKILLGSSGGGQFLVVIPEESRPQAEEFLQAARTGIEQVGGGTLRLVWAATENLGAWSDVRKRLSDAMAGQRNAPATGIDSGFFQPFNPVPPSVRAPEGFFEELHKGLRSAETVGWSPDDPVRIQLGDGKHTWTLGSSPESIPLARHAAPADGEEARRPASLRELARRSSRPHAWGVLRGDVDNFGPRIRQAQTIEEHVLLSVLYKQFFAGELDVLCSLPEFWRKVTVLYSGGDDFAVYGSWDALILLARELQRLFHRFAEENLKEFAGLEGKTVSMALALAPSPGASLASVFEEAGRNLEYAKSVAKDSFYLFGRPLEWKHLGDAIEMKDIMARMVKQYRCPVQFLHELGSFYRRGEREAWEAKGRAKGNRFERPWRFARRLNRILGPTRDRELQRLRGSLMNEFVGRNAAHVKLRPAGRVALEWAVRTTEA
ncbi:MAG: Cas10/Cmr2 second palm domain-containing protein [Bryobacteraceae bacterium]